MQHARPPRSIERAEDPIHQEVLSKPGGGSRILTHLGEHDRRRFDAAVAAVTRSVEGALTPSAFANRARRTDGGLELEPWHLARIRYVGAIQAVSKGPFRAAFVGDVRDCYGSITPSTVERALTRIGARADRGARIGELLREFHSRGVRGLPIGPKPSAVLANAVLAPVERALADAAAGPAFRWVDDVVVLATDARTARRAAAAFDSTLDELGLAAHPGKCRVVDDPHGVLPSASMPSAPGPPGVA